MKTPSTLAILVGLFLAVSVSLGQVQKNGETDGRDTRSGGSTNFDANSTLEDYLLYAALNNAGLKAAFNRWKAAVERIPQARSLPDPRFTYTYYIEEVETRVGPQRQKFGVAQMFPWFGKLRLKGDAMAEDAAATRQEYEKRKLELFRSVKTAYYEYWYLAQAISVTREHLSLVANMERVARIRFKAGTTANSSVIQAQVELGKLDDRLRSLEALRKPIIAELNAALNRPTHLPLPWPGSIPEVAVSFSDEEAMQWLAESSPELDRLDHLVRKEEAGIKLAKRAYYPDFSLGVDYVDTGAALSDDTPDSGKDPVMAMVSVKMPIWFGKYRAAERESHLRMTAAQQERENAGKQLEAELELALYHFRDAERKVDLYGDTLVPKGRQSLDVTRQGFEAGNATFISLIDAERLLLEFQLAEQRARADRGQRLAEIEELTGKQVGREKQ